MRSEPGVGSLVPDVPRAGTARLTTKLPGGSVPTLLGTSPPGAVPAAAAASPPTTPDCGEARNSGLLSAVRRPPRIMESCEPQPDSTLANGAEVTTASALSGDLMLTDLRAHVEDWMAVCGYSTDTRTVTRDTLERFVRFARAHGITHASAVTPQLVATFITAPGRDRRPPAVATMHQRRSVVRVAFRLYHRADPSVVDPTYDLTLPARSTLTVRPLSDDELDVLRAVSLSTLIETRQPAIVALAEAGAVTTEIAAVSATDIDVGAGTVSLPGARHATPRTVPLTEWGASQLARRSRDSTGPLTYRGGAAGNAAQASISVALRRMFTAAGFGQEIDLRLGSVRAVAGRRAFDTSGRIEDAARVLGCRSLDTAARLIGWEWT